MTVSVKFSSVIHLLFLEKFPYRVKFYTKGE